MRFSNTVPLCFSVRWWCNWFLWWKDFMQIFFSELFLCGENNELSQWKYLSKQKVLFQSQIWIRDFFDAFRLADAPSAIFLVFLLTFCSALECFVYIFLCGAAVSSSSSVTWWIFVLPKFLHLQTSKAVTRPTCMTWIMFLNWYFILPRRNRALMLL